MWHQPTNHTLLERLRALAAFRPQFEQPGFVFSEWVPPRSEEPNVVHAGGDALSGDALAFIKMAYDEDWVRGDFSWGAWKATAEAAALRDNPDALAAATDDQLMRLLTTIIRQNRFCEGTLSEAFEMGLLTAICRRAERLADELAAGRPRP